MRLVLLALSAPLLLAMSAATDDHPETIEHGGERLVCKRMPPTTGSRLGSVKLCRTESEWKRDTQDSQKLLRDRQRAPITTHGQ